MKNLVLGFAVAMTGISAFAGPLNPHAVRIFGSDALELATTVSAATRANPEQMQKFFDEGNGSICKASAKFVAQVGDAHTDYVLTVCSPGPAGKDIPVGVITITEREKSGGDIIIRSYTVSEIQKPGQIN